MQFKYFFLLSFLVCTFGMYAQQTVGTFLNSERSFNGYTLFSNNGDTYLIDNCGFIVNSWESSFRPGQSVYLLENGNLLRTGTFAGSFQGGGQGGIFELFNWDGDLLWSYRMADDDIHAHHDIAPLPNGNFLAIAWARRSEEEASAAGRREISELWSECIFELEILPDNQANIVWKWDVWDHLVQDWFTNRENFDGVNTNPGLVDINYLNNNQFSQGDWIHLNAIDYNPELDQIALSSRNYNEIWVIDHSTSTQEAASSSGGRYGKGGDLLYRYGNPAAYKQGSQQDQLFFQQHDIRWIPEDYPNGGKFMIFNNKVLSDQSRVEIWSAALDGNGDYLLENNVFPSVTRDWEFTKEGMYSERISGANMLPNGNVLICEGRSGEFWEVTPQKQRVWKYINPINRNGSSTSQGGTIRYNDTFRATRYAPDYPAFEGRDLSPTIPVEINPWDLDCIIYSDEMVSTNELSEEVTKVLTNPIQDEFIVEVPHAELELQVFDMIGCLILKKSLQIGTNIHNFQMLPKGMYVAIFTKENRLVKSEKLIKF